MDENGGLVGLWYAAVSQATGAWGRYYEPREVGQFVRYAGGGTYLVEYSVADGAQPGELGVLNVTLDGHFPWLRVFYTEEELDTWLEERAQERVRAHRSGDRVEGVL